MQQDSAAAESSRLTEAMAQQQEEIHELHKAVHALKMQLLDANRRCKKIQEQLKVNLVKEEKKEVPEEKKPSQEEKEKEQEKSTTEEPAKEGEQEPEADQDESTSHPTTTETPPTTATPPLATPPPPTPSRSQEANAIAKVDEQLGTASASASASASNNLTYEEDDGTNWQRILANRGYDTDYLTKSHERQYAEGGNLELAKGTAYEAPLSQEYASYPDFQADEPAPAADSNDTEGKAKRAASAWSVKQRAHMLNVELNKVGGGDSSSSSDTTPSPYAMQGKFLSRRSTARSSSRLSPEAMEDEGWVRSTRQARLPQRRPKKEAKKVTPAPKKVTPSSSSSRITTQASVSSTKLDRLVDVLNDLLRLQLQKERRSSVSASSLRRAPAKSVNGLSKSPKRLRRRPSATTIRSSTRT